MSPSLAAVRLLVLSTLRILSRFLESGPYISLASMRSLTLNLRNQDDILISNVLAVQRQCPCASLAASSSPPPASSSHDTIGECVRCRTASCSAPCCRARPRIGTCGSACHRGKRDRAQFRPLPGFTSTVRVGVAITRGFLPSISRERVWQ